MVNFGKLNKIFFTSRGFKTKKEALDLIKKHDLSGKDFINEEDVITFLCSHSKTKTIDQRTCRELNDDVLYCILQYLDIKSLYYVGLVCKKFWKISSKIVFWDKFGGSKMQVLTSQYRFRCYHEIFSDKVNGICINCRNDSYYKLITATKAITEYKIKKNQLFQIPNLVFQNPYNKNGQPMRLYYERDIKIKNKLL